MLEVGPLGCGGGEHIYLAYPNILFGLSFLFVFVGLCVGSSAREAVAKEYKLEGFNNRNLSLHCAGGQMFQSQCVIGVASFRGLRGNLFQKFLRGL